MIRTLSSFFLCMLPSLFMAQSFELLTPLAFEVTETSGLICLNNRVITHNDSANEPELYEIDTLTGNVLRTVAVTNVPNIDWEDITYDDTYIYVGDFGNLDGNRTNLSVIRIALSDYFEVENDVVTAEIISYNYADQTDFTPAQFATNYDAEALISYGDSLYIFTKNWVDSRTNIYALSKNPGSYTLTRKDSIDTGGLVTGASINEDTGELMLACYNLLNPYALLITNYTDASFSQGTVQTFSLPIPNGYSFQIEAVCRAGSGIYYFTAEGGVLGNAGFYKLNLNPNQVIEKEHVGFSIHPNPTSDYFNILTDEAVIVTIFNSEGKLMKSETSTTINVSEMPKGQYLIQIRGRADQLLSTQKLIVQ